MIKNKHVEEYIKLYETGKIKLNKERILLIKYLKKYILVRDDIYFDTKTHENYIKFTEKWYFKLDVFQKFITAFVFLFYKEDNSVFYEQFFYFMARGAGKNGLISSLCHFFISELHGIPKYNVSIVANSELQAKTSFKEVYDVIEANDVLDDMFYRTKMEITGNATKSIIQYHTSNANTKDGLRDGCVIYDEIHQMENFDTVNVFSSGLGKVPNAREFFIGTDGYVRDGFLDKLKERSMNILKGESLDDPLFPFICKIDDPKQVDDPSQWELANPMFHEPMNDYAKGLFKKVKTQYNQLVNNPSGREEFMTKRMNLPEEDLEKSVATWEEILATNQPIPDLSHRTCVGAVDFASIRDFAAVGLLFKVDGKYVWKTHSFVRAEFLRKVKLKAPIKEWEDDGLLTIVDEPVIQVSYIVDWFSEMREKYGLTRIVADTFRLDLVKTALENEGFEVVYVRNPKAASAKLAPRMETLFSNGDLIYGDNPLMRWYTNNVLVKIDKFGNKSYEKKDEFRRKTDGFMAMIYAFWEADNILEEETEFFLGAIDF
ncbi:terminase TerL endonuclease subunit [Oceanobacillus caeni]